MTVNLQSDEVGCTAFVTRNLFVEPSSVTPLGGRVLRLRHGNELFRLLCSVPCTGWTRMKLKCYADTAGQADNLMRLFETVWRPICMKLGCCFKCGVDDNVYNAMECELIQSG